MPTARLSGVLILLALSTFAPPDLRAQNETLRVEPDAVARPADAPCPQPRSALVYASLQRAVDCSRPGDRIHLGSGTFQGPGFENVRITGERVIRGEGPDATLIHGAGRSRLFTVPSGAALRLEGLSLTGGWAPGRGGALVSSGEVVADRVVFRDNAAGDRGGAIRSTGRLVLRDSLLEANRAQAEGGAVSSTGQLEVFGSRFRDNAAILGSALDNSGGRARIRASLFQGSFLGPAESLIWSGNQGAELEITDSTLTGNGTGIASFRQTRIAGVTVAGMTTGLELGASARGSVSHSAFDNQRDCRLSDWSRVRSDGFNLAADDSCATLLIAPGDQQGHPAGLGRLAGHGGPTESFRVLPDSPLLDAGDPECRAGRDQRGVPRPQGDACDIGATEAVAAPVLVTIPFDGLDFGAAGVGTPGPERSLVLQNLDRDPLDVISLGMNGENGDFPVAASDCPGRRLDYLDSCQVTLRFEPRETGAISRTRYFLAENRHGELVSVEVEVHGTGRLPGLDIHPPLSGLPAPFRSLPARLLLDLTSLAPKSRPPQPGIGSAPAEDPP